MKPATLKSAALLAACLALTSCASQPAPSGFGDPGFFYGVLHGVIAPVAFIVSIFDHDVRIYAFPNNGVWYDFGWLLGLLFWAGGGAASRSR